MSLWCDNPREHEREGQRDYERGGRYGYDSQQYNDHWDDCAKHYQQGFNEARREDERQQEMREEREAEERRSERRAYEHRQEERQREEEEEYYRQQQEQYSTETESASAEYLTHKFLKSLNWSRKRRLNWCRLHGVKFKPTIQF